MRQLLSLVWPRLHPLATTLARFAPALSSSARCSCAQVAKDASTVLPEHSPFTAALLSTLTKPDLPLTLLSSAVKDAVVKDTGGVQVPEVKHDLSTVGALTVLFPPR